MPVLKHAKKKMRQDKKRTQQNKRVRTVYKTMLKKAREEKTLKAISAAFSSLDKAAKQNIIHKNKASRLKANLAKLLSIKTPVVEKSAKVEKKVAPKKKATKKTV